MAGDQKGVENKAVMVNKLCGSSLTLNDCQKLSGHVIAVSSTSHLQPLWRLQITAALSLSDIPSWGGYLPLGDKALQSSSPISLSAHLLPLVFGPGPDNSSNSSRCKKKFTFLSVANTFVCLAAPCRLQKMTHGSLLGDSEWQIPMLFSHGSLLLNSPEQHDHYCKKIILPETSMSKRRWFSIRNKSRHNWS